MTTMILTRHGHVEGITPPRFRGQYELPLTALGEQQADRVADYIARTWQPKIVLHSPLERCRVTAGRIAEACRVPQQSDADLLDIHYGEWQWKTHEDVKARWPALYALWRSAPHLVRFPAGESVQDIILRGADMLRKVAKDYPDDTIVLVGHDSINRALLIQLLDQPLSAYWKIAQGPCCINVLNIAGAQVSISAINNMQHLDGLG